MSSEPTAAGWDGAGGAVDRPLFADPKTVFDAVQDVLGRKWHLRIVYRLLESGPMGFSALKGDLAGVSSKMLSESLSTLEAEGLVDREIVSDQPVRVEYSLTERGAALEPVVVAVVRWGSEYGLDGENESADSGVTDDGATEAGAAEDRATDDGATEVGPNRGPAWGEGDD